MRFLFTLVFFPLFLQAQRKPNIIFIMSDDHDADAISAYNSSLIQTPNIDRIARQGIRFNKAFVGNSICSPSRATLLTGQHSHKNGVKDNFTRFDSSKLTVAGILSSGGYHTGLIGKWHLHSYPTGFNYWRILPGMGQYFDTRMITMQGDTIIEKGYATDVITTDALNWLDSIKKEKPFALFLHHKAPHRNFVPDLKHLEIFSKKTFPEPSTLFTDPSGRGTAWQKQTMDILTSMRLGADLKIDPELLKDLPEFKVPADDAATYSAIMKRMPEKERERFRQIYAERARILREQRPSGKTLLKYKYQWYMQDYLACIASIDENIGRVLDYLKNNGLEKNTAVIYTSDQNFYLGENGWFDKRFAYDVSMGTPLLVRWPGEIHAGTVNNTMVQNIDYAPTLLDLAGIKIPSWMQGKSLKALMTGKQKKLPRKYLYYRYYEYGKDHTVLPHIAIRSDLYKLIYFHTVNEWELYDLVKDPHELVNVINHSSYQKIVSGLKKELVKLKNEYDDREPAGELR